jgi:hypothetical protein
MGQDRGLMDTATPHCEACSQVLERVSAEHDQWACTNADCPRHGEQLTIAS